jgi:hypothetical protein
MSQQAIAAGGTALVALTFATGPRRAVLSRGLLESSPSPAQTAAAKRELLNLGGALVFVAGATLLAGQSAAWSSAMLAVIAGLMILFAINRYGKAPTK